MRCNCTNYLLKFYSFWYFYKFIRQIHIVNSEKCKQMFSFEKFIVTYKSRILCIVFRVTLTFET